MRDTWKNLLNKISKSQTLRKKCLYSKFSGPYFSEFGLKSEIYLLVSVQMRENTDQTNSNYGHLFCNESCCIFNRNESVIIEVSYYLSYCAKCNVTNNFLKYSRIFFKYKDISCDFFHELLGEGNNSKIWETNKIFVDFARDYCAMTSLSLAHKNIYAPNVNKRNIFQNKIYDRIYLNYTVMFCGQPWNIISFWSIFILLT